MFSICNVVLPSKKIHDLVPVIRRLDPACFVPCIDSSCLAANLNSIKSASKSYVATRETMRQDLSIALKLHWLSCSLQGTCAARALSHSTWSTIKIIDHSHSHDPKIGYQSVIRRTDSGTVMSTSSSSLASSSPLRKLLLMRAVGQHHPDLRMPANGSLEHDVAPIRRPRRKIVAARLVGHLQPVHASDFEYINVLPAWVAGPVLAIPTEGKHPPFGCHEGETA